MKVLKLPYSLVTYADDRLFSRFFRVRSPFSLLIMGDGSGQLEQNPTQSDLNESDMYFLGGHRNVLSDEQVNAIQNAGYGEYIEDVPDVQDRLPRRKPRKLG